MATDSLSSSTQDTRQLSGQSSGQSSGNPESGRRLGSVPLLSTGRGSRLASSPISAPLAQNSQNLLSGHGLEPQVLRTEPSKKLTVGKEISLSGEISSCEHLVVEGEVKADIIDARVVEITHEGVFNGKVVADVIRVEGVLQGDVKATENLIVKPGGTLSGKITYSELLVEPGGKIDGTLRHINSLKSGIKSGTESPSRESQKKA